MQAHCASQVDMASLLRTSARAFGSCAHQARLHRSGAASLRVCSSSPAVEAAAEASTSGAAHAELPQAPAFKAFVDFKFVRDNLELVRRNCAQRLSGADPDRVAQLYEAYCALQQETDALRAARNENSSAMKVRAAP